MSDGNTERTNDTMRQMRKQWTDWLPLLGCRDRMNRRCSGNQRVSISGRRKLYLCNEMQSQGHANITAAFKDFRLEAGKEISWKLFFCPPPISSQQLPLAETSCRLKPAGGKWLSHPVALSRGGGEWGIDLKATWLKMGVPLHEESLKWYSVFRMGNRCGPSWQLSCLYIIGTKICYPSWFSPCVGSKEHKESHILALLLA